MYNVSGITHYYRYLSQKYSSAPVASRKRVLIVIGPYSVEGALTRGRGQGREEHFEIFKKTSR